MSQSSSLGKWLAGIAATVIGAVVIWWLTHPGSPLNPVTPTPAPHPSLKVIDFTVTDAYVGERAQASLTVYNEGDGTGESCSVSWYSGSAWGKLIFSPAERMVPEEGPSPQAAVSAAFGLLPKETRKINLSSLVYTEPGTFWSFAQVSCRDYNSSTWGVNFTSQEFYKEVKVVPGP